MRKLLFFDVDGTLADRVGKKNVVPQLKSFRKTATSVL